MRTPTIVTVFLLSLVTACTGAPQVPPVVQKSPPPVDPTTPADVHAPYTAVQAALGARASVEAALLDDPVGKRAWDSVSEGYLPAVERYEDLRLTKFAKEPDAPREDFAPESVLAWSADDQTLVVSESVGSGSGYRLAGYRWHEGRPLQVFQLPANALGRYQSQAGAHVTIADPAVIEPLIAYRSSGKLPKGITLDDDQSVTFKESRIASGNKHFTEKVTCTVANDGAGSLAWQFPVSGGTLTLAAIRCRSKAAGKDGWTIQHNDWDRAITKVKRYFARVDCDEVFPMSVFVSAAGKTTWGSPSVDPVRVCKGS